MSQRDHTHMRQRLALQAAQILLDSGTRDFHAAKQKAAQQLGATETKSLPSNAEIESALIEYQRLFRAQSQPVHLLRLRKIAIEAMHFLQQYNPRLVGSVLNGSADEHSVIRLHLFADTVESVGFYLMDNQIPNKLGERRLKIGADHFENFSLYQFLVDTAPVELLVFLPGQRHAPVSPIDGKVMKRADVIELERLLDKTKTE